jgi:multiple sugar transport system substrate-binding protein
MSGFSRRDFLKTFGAGGAGLMLAQAGWLRLAAQAAVSGNVNYWHHFTSESEFRGLEQVMALFSERFPDVRLVQENIPNADFMARFTAGVLANTRADVSMVTTERLADMVAMDGLVPLTDRVSNWSLGEFFPENRWRGITRDGEIYGVPAFSFVDWMYYRKDWFEEAGIEPPTTFDEFRAAAQAMTDPERGRYGFGMRAGGGGQIFIIDMIEAFGSPIVVDGEVAIDRALAIEAIDFWSGLYRDGLVPPSAPGDSYRQIMEGFKTGQTAMVWHHTGSLAEISAALTGDEFATAVKPEGPRDTITRTSFLYNGMMRQNNADAAWAWISFWGEADPAIAFLDATGYFPASSAVAADARITENPIYAPATAAASVGKLPPQFVGFAGWAQEVVLPAFQRVLTGESTVEQAVDEMIDGLADAL